MQTWLKRNEIRDAQGAAGAIGIEAPGLAHIDAAAVGALRKMRAGKHADLYAKLVELYRAGSAESLEKLRLAIAAGDLSAAAAVCHRFAAASANVGALEYGKQLRHLEDLCIAGDLANADKLNATLQSTHAALLDSLRDRRHE